MSTTPLKWDFDPGPGASRQTPPRRTAPFVWRLVDTKNWSKVPWSGQEGWIPTFSYSLYIAIRAETSAGRGAVWMNR